MPPSPVVFCGFAPLAAAPGFRAEPYSLQNVNSAEGASQPHPSHSPQLCFGVRTGTTVLTCAMIEREQPRA